jgi:hypothetical protein
LAPERMHITEDMLSPFSRQLYEDQDIRCGKVEKLVPNLHNKTKYIIHYRNLQLYRKLGMRLTKIHRVLTFRQSHWLSEYINYNTRKRMEATTEFEKDYRKLLNNSFFGKTMENLRNRVDVKLVSDLKKCAKWTSRPQFHAVEVFNEHLAALQLKKKSLCLNKPIYVGFCVLDLSKHLMYSFHYETMKPHFEDVLGKKIRLCFTDTDSLLYEIQTDDVYRDLLPLQNEFDFSDYPRDHLLYCPDNKKVPGKMHDEHSGACCREFIGLRPKVYSVQMADGVEKRKVKGVVGAVRDNDLSHKLFHDCLFQSLVMEHTGQQIRSFRHQLYTVEQTKRSLCPGDNKRWILDDRITTRAHGHFENEIDLVELRLDEMGLRTDAYI